MIVDPRIEAYFEKHTEWKKELLELRAILLSSELVEQFKWGSPVYTIENKNIVGIGAFKSYFGLWFFQGALLKDHAKVLVNAQEGKTKALRQWRFKEESAIDRALIKKYILEAIENQKKGLEIKSAPKKAIPLPIELKKALNENQGLKEDFNALSPSKQREYSEYISEAKRKNTRIKRLEKSIALIHKRMGLHDQYKK